MKAITAQVRLKRRMAFLARQRLQILYLRRTEMDPRKICKGRWTQQMVVSVIEGASKDELVAAANGYGCMRYPSPKEQHP